MLLLEIGDDDAAEAKLLAEPARIHGDNYGALVFVGPLEMPY